ncbi:MAG: HD-GYP domain-containing protein [Longimicrobiaceae bacterium]
MTRTPPPTVSSDRDLQQAGKRLVLALHAALRALKLYPLDNKAVQSALAEVQQAASRILEREGEMQLRSVGEVFFVNDARMRADLSSYASFDTVRRAFRRHGAGEMRVAPEAGTQDWTAVLSLLLRDGSREDAFEDFSKRLAGSPARAIEFEPEKRGGVPGEGNEQARTAAKRTYSRGVDVAREVMNGVRMGKGVSLRKVKRAVQSVVDQVLNNESSILGMTTLRDYDEYLFTHSVNVCIFSVALGKKIGLDRQQLYDLGMGALLHDLGKVELPIEMITKPGPLSEEEWRRMRDHPSQGMLHAFGMEGLSELPLRAMLTIYEHHMKQDGTGYPSFHRPRTPTLFPKIVGVADGFDAATSKRSYQSEPWTPDRVLKEMRDNQQRGFDPLLVKAFVSMTGVYPVGSLVILDTFEMAVVTAPNPDPERFHQPMARLVFDGLGMPVDDPFPVDLSETDPATGVPRRTIVKTTDPERYGIDVGSYFT